MATLLNVTITGALANQLGSVVQIRQSGPANLAVHANFTYGSGGTSVDAYVQTSFDGGSTWCDIANFHFLVASLRKLFNLSPFTPVTTIATPGDGALTANTAVDGVLGSLLRVKWTSVGTYAGGTKLVIDASGAARITPQAQ